MTAGFGAGLTAPDPPMAPPRHAQAAQQGRAHQQQGARLRGAAHRGVAADGAGHGGPGGAVLGLQHRDELARGLARVGHGEQKVHLVRVAQVLQDGRAGGFVERQVAEVALEGDLVGRVKAHRVQHQAAGHLVGVGNVLLVRALLAEVLRGHVEVGVLDRALAADGVVQVAEGVAHRHVAGADGIEKIEVVQAHVILVEHVAAAGRGAGDSGLVGIHLAPALHLEGVVAAKGEGGRRGTQRQQQNHRQQRRQQETERAWLGGHGKHSSRTPKSYCYHTLLDNHSGPINQVFWPGYNQAPRLRIKAQKRVDLEMPACQQILTAKVGWAGLGPWPAFWRKPLQGRHNSKSAPGGARRETGLGRFISETTREYLLILARVSSMGIAMVLATVMGLGAGWLVDKYFGTHPWGFFIGLGMGIVAGFRNLYILYKRSERAQERIDQREKKQGKQWRINR
eukprot:TRINITY_DN5755_c0_g2_i1.p1 TRINITY_DN5755_c0_g2~~TRINITY_DN5755_c0_g2_i1.p1  ORF type:complete len:453 (+),score=109.77 TRINITY_DN5755_c0_g2_i1:30-1388(+)